MQRLLRDIDPVNYVLVDLIWIGGHADGGCLIPDIFNRIVYCLSPGVADTADFEAELSRRYDIKSFMIGGSVASVRFAEETSILQKNSWAIARTVISLH